MSSTGGVVYQGRLAVDKPRNNAEEKLAHDVVAFFRWALPADVAWTHIPLGGQRHTRAAQRMVGLGAHAGWPDYVLVWKGAAIFIELKREKGGLSAVQKHVHKQLFAAGADVCVCRSLAEVEATLLRIGMRLKARLNVTCPVDNPGDNFGDK